MTQNKTIVVYINQETIFKINNAVRDKAFKKLPYYHWIFFNCLSAKVKADTMKK